MQKKTAFTSKLTNGSITTGGTCGCLLFYKNDWNKNSGMRSTVFFVDHMPHGKKRLVTLASRSYI